MSTKRLGHLQQKHQLTHGRVLHDNDHTLHDHISNKSINPKK